MLFNYFMPKFWFFRSKFVKSLVFQVKMCPNCWVFRSNCHWWIVGCLFFLQGGWRGRMGRREFAGNEFELDQFAGDRTAAVRRVQLPRRGRQRPGTQCTQSRILLHGHSTWRYSTLNSQCNCVIFRTTFVFWMKKSIFINIIIMIIKDNQINQIKPFIHNVTVIIRIIFKGNKHIY